MAPLPEYLRGLGVVRPPVPTVASAAHERFVDAFVGYLVSERGLAASTIDNYRRVAVRFLSMKSDWPDGIAGVGAEQVSRLIPYRRAPVKVLLFDELSAASGGSLTGRVASFVGAACVSDWLCPVWTC